MSRVFKPKREIVVVTEGFGRVLVLPPTWSLMKRFRAMSDGKTDQLEVMAEAVAECALDPETRQPLFGSVQDVNVLRGYEDDIMAVGNAVAGLSDLSKESITDEKKDSSAPKIQET